MFSFLNDLARSGRHAELRVRKPFSSKLAGRCPDTPGGPYLHRRTACSSYRKSVPRESSPPMHVCCHDRTPFSLNLYAHSSRSPAVSRTTTVSCPTVCMNVSSITDGPCGPPGPGLLVVLPDDGEGAVLERLCAKTTGARRRDGQFDRWQMQLSRGAMC
jgi:hypothetical protein